MQKDPDDKYESSDTSTLPVSVFLLDPEVALTIDAIPITPSRAATIPRPMRYAVLFDFDAVSTESVALETSAPGNTRGVGVDGDQAAPGGGGSWEIGGGGRGAESDADSGGGGSGEETSGAWEASRRVPQRLQNKSLILIAKPQPPQNPLGGGGGS